MTYEIPSFIFISLYFILMLGIGYWISKKENQDSFVIGNRNIGFLGTSGSLAASFRDGTGIAFWISMGIAGGYGGLWLFVGVMIAALFFCIYAPKLRVSANTTNHLTINEAVHHTVGAYTGKVTALVSLAFCFCIIALQFFVAGGIFSSLLHQSQWIGVLSVGVIVFIYMMLGGYKSVIITDTIQFFFIFSLLFVPLIVQPQAQDIMNVQSLLDFPNENKLAFIIFGALYFLNLPEAWQRVYSARDSKTIRISFPLVTLFLVVMSLSLVWLGMGMKVLGGEVLSKYSESYLSIFDPSLGLSPWLLGYICMVFLAITMSTQSASTYVFASTINKNFFARHKSDNQAEYISKTKIMIAIVLVVTAVSSLLISSVVKAFFDMIGFFICLAPVYMVTVMNPQWLQNFRSRDMYLAGLTVAGILFYVSLFVMGITEKSFLMSTVPAVAIGVGIILTGIFRNIKSRHSKN